MPLVPFTPPPTAPRAPWGPPTPRPPVTRVSQLPVAKRMNRKRFWLLLLAFTAVALVWEPARILGCVLVFYWVLAIGIMPHVALMKLGTGSHRE